MNYLLISVYDRDITTEYFETQIEAYKQMLKEVKDEYLICNEEKEWKEIEDISYNQGFSYKCDNFGFSFWSAWSNLDDDCNCDWKIIKVFDNHDPEWFGQVRWCDADLENALEERGFLTTEKNISKLRSKLEHHSFTDQMVASGWDYIYQMIENDNDWD